MGWGLGVTVMIPAGSVTPPTTVVLRPSVLVTTGGVYVFVPQKMGIGVLVVVSEAPMTEIEPFITLRSSCTIQLAISALPAVAIQKIVQRSILRTLYLRGDSDGKRWWLYRACQENHTFCGSLVKSDTPDWDGSRSY